LGEVLALSPYGLVDTLRMLRALEITGCLEFGRAVSGNTFAASVRTTPSLHTLDSDEAPAVRLRRVTGEQERVRRVRTSDTSIDATLDRSVDGSISGEETPERSTDRGRRRRSRPRPRETGPDLIKAETNFSKGKRSLDAEEIEQAIAHFQLACRQDPHQPLFRMYLAWAQYQGAPPNDRKARFEAQEQLKAALEADGGQDEGFVLLGNVFRTQGNAEGALKNYRRALELNRRNAAARAAVRELEGTEEKKERDNPGLFKFFRR
ncbi:MAG: tetratricopeptide repeat protein, partial [Myxococcales bacterium]|nr:tetratricopeptide repeat protein [Myxococcales bacterium]